MVIWRKSTRSGANGGDCVELGLLEDGRLGVRDSKNPEQGHQSYRRGVVKKLLDDIKAGKFDLD